MPEWESASSPEVIFSIGSHTTSQSSLSCNNGKGEVPFLELVPPLFIVLQFPMLWQNCTHALLASTQFTGFLELTIGAKA